MTVNVRMSRNASDQLLYQVWKFILIFICAPTPAFRLAFAYCFSNCL